MWEQFIEEWKETRCCADYMRLIDGNILVSELMPYFQEHLGTDVGHGIGMVLNEICAAPTVDAVPVVHGRWIEQDDYPDDAYYHHKCSNCNTTAPFGYKYIEDWDEGMDGEWYSLGIIDCGIIEHITSYCPNCGARMDGVE